MERGWRPSVSRSQQRPLQRSPVLQAVALFALAAAMVQVCSWSFLPTLPMLPSPAPPPPAEPLQAEAVGFGPMEWWSRATAADMAIWEMNARRVVQDGIDGASRALQ